MTLILVIVIFIGIFTIDKMNTIIQKLKRENSQLKVEIEKLRTKLRAEKTENAVSDSLKEEKNTEDIIKTENVQKVQEKVVNEEQVESKGTIKEKRKLSDEQILRRKAQKQKIERERKNTNILVVGAILIVLAAIVFLMSTWRYTNNLLKTAIMALVAVFFLKISDIADKKYGLKKASKTFFYISMAYIPICLISFSVFGLLGEYFSINGPGKYIYLAISFIVTSMIYYFNYSKIKTKELFVGTILSQILAIILFLLTFGDSIYLILTVLLAYNLVLKSSKFVEEEVDISNVICKAITYISTAILTVSFIDHTDIKVIAMIFALINFIYNKSKNNIDLFFINLIIYEIGYYLLFITFGDVPKNITLVIGAVYTLVVSTLQYIILNKENEIISVVFRIFSILILVGIGYSVDYNAYFIPLLLLVYDLVIKFFDNTGKDRNVINGLYKFDSILSLFVVTVLFHDVSYLKIATMILLAINTLYKDNKNLLNSLLLNIDLYEIGLYLSFVQFDSFTNNISLLFIISYTIIVFVIQYLINNSDSYNFYVSSIITLAVILLSMLFGIFSNSDIKPYVFLAIEAVIMLAILFKNKEEWKYPLAIILPIDLIFMFCNIMQELNLNIFVYLVFAVLVFVASEIINLKDKVFKNSICIISNIFMSIIFILVAQTELSVDKEVIFVLLLLVTYGYNFLKFSRNEKLEMLTIYAAILPIICIESLNSEIKIFIYVLLTLFTTYFSIIKRKASLNTLISLVYLAITIYSFELIYAKYIVAIAWAIANMLYSENGLYKDLLKAVSYILGFLLYKQVLIDLDIVGELHSIELMGLLIVAIILSRTIVVKYTKEIDIIEYLGFTAVYLFALVNYYDEKDGMIFIAFTVAVLFLSYYKKYGNIFVVSLIAILVNAILLTRKFWILVPWWIYLLVIGSVLITFAVRNESNENKLQKNDARNIIKKIKDKVENEK